MRRRGLLTVVAGASVWLLTPVGVHAQADAEPLRTSWGHPDLQGIWTSATYTPLQRPKNLGDREFLTAEEFEKLNSLVTADGVDPLAARGILAADDQTGRAAGLEQPSDTHYDNAVWLTTERPRQLSTRRTSMITDPPTGRLPEMLPAARARADARRANNSTDSYENRPFGERCVIWTHEGPPMQPAAYNDLYQIFQTEDQVVILQEMNINGPRIIPLDDRPPLPSSVRLWRGDSRGHWDGETLVVETANYNGRNPFNGSSNSLRVIERFRRLDAENIRYEFTVEDPETWERPWTAEYPLMQREGPLYEYACHEGNYDLRHILEVARNLEKAEAAQSSR